MMVGGAVIGALSPTICPAKGERVIHIMGPSQVDEASLTPGAEVSLDGTIIYPAKSPQFNASSSIVVQAMVIDGGSGL